MMINNNTYPWKGSTGGGGSDAGVSPLAKMEVEV